MVKLGLLNLVRDIVASLSQQDRADVVSQVSKGNLSMRFDYLLQLTPRATGWCNGS